MSSTPSTANTVTKRRGRPRGSKDTKLRASRNRVAVLLKTGETINVPLPSARQGQKSQSLQSAATTLSAEELRDQLIRQAATEALARSISDTTRSVLSRRFSRRPTVELPTCDESAASSESDTESDKDDRYVSCGDDSSDDESDAKSQRASPVRRTTTRVLSRSQSLRAQSLPNESSLSMSDGEQQLSASPTAAVTPSTPKTPVSPASVMTPSSELSLSWPNSSSSLVLPQSGSEMPSLVPPPLPLAVSEPLSLDMALSSGVRPGDSFLFSLEPLDWEPPAYAHDSLISAL